MAIEDLVVRLSGANQYRRPPLEVQPGSTAITHRSALAAIPARKVRKRRVGIPEMVLRRYLARRPRPRVSRPVGRASAKSRSSMTMERHPLIRATRRIAAIAPRSRLLPAALFGDCSA